MTRADAQATPEGLGYLRAVTTPGAQTQASIEVSINGEPRALAPPCTVAELLGQLELGRGRIAVAVNEAVIPRSRHAAHALESGDRIEILEAVGGG